ncbi:dTMP kinase [Larsenimonas suaedae]|uniref:Thymidylate kinase n=1 Tax=Larsenimonas suaedae TaxID=1851019 RepID=A0ABU1GWB1_9GAMM|nr:dTMP kinase [Larsenimonas suaedae]MCM2971127.1 dTMP kinase [Larsenimonas suaedae]MDR5895836.1 dTMP kinase [Larsenimonas suaedae]
MTVRRGAFITLEGSEGVGKTTNVRFVCERLESMGHEVIRTREPGGTPRAEQIRGLLLAPDSEEPLSDLAELLLVFSARAQHLEQVIRPALARGAFVVCDRFTDATYAYQGAARGCDTKAIEHLEALVQQGLSPDLTLLLDMPVSAAAERLASRGGQADRFEQERSVFFERVRAGYLAAAQRAPERIETIDAARPLEDVQGSIDEALTRLLAAWN